MHPLSHVPAPPLGFFKAAGDTTKVYALSGELYLSSSGWLLLKVPNALGRGLFAALDETGVELPTRDTDDPESVYNAHISVCNPDEVAQMGGPDAVSERGKHFHYGISQIATVDPTTWSGVSRCWIAIVESPELKEFRKSYGLTPLPHGDWEFHITFGIRKTGVLGPNEISKTGGVHGRMECRECGDVIMSCRCPVEEWGTNGHKVIKVLCRACKRKKHSGDSVDVNTKEAEGFYQQALMQEPIQWNTSQSWMDNILQHLGKVHSRGQNLIAQRGNDLSVLSSLDPQLQMQRFHNTLAGKSDVVTDPVDRTINAFTGVQ